MRYRLIRAVLTMLISLGATAAWGDGVTSRLTLPPGFSVSLYANVPGARSLALAPQLNALFVSTRGAQVYAIDLNEPGPHAARVVLSDLKVANGIAWKDGYLYVAEQHRLVRFAAPSLDAVKQARAEVLYDKLPDKRHHGWRYIAFGADGALYMGVGAPCNACTVEGLEGTVTKFTPGQWDAPEIVAAGVRNTVGMDSHPVTGVLHFTDNGIDMMGDDRPREELNALVPGTHPVAHYGFPWYGGGRDRTSFDEAPLPENTVFPVQTFQAHVAPLGVDFYTGTQFPAAYIGDAFVAQHGSWNRSERVGYQVVRVQFNAAGDAIGHEPFISGWLRPNQSVTGRPVDIEELPDGSIAISDDSAGRIYRVTYQTPSQ